MSLKTFFKKIGDFFARLFKSLAKELQKAVSIGVEVTEAIKKFDEKNPMVADILTSIIPGDVDDRIKERMRVMLPKIVIELRLVDSAKGLTDPDEIMLAAVKVIQQLDGDYKSAFLHNFSILAAQAASDGKLSWSDAVYLMEWYYRNKFK